MGAILNIISGLFKVFDFFKSKNDQTIGKNLANGANAEKQLDDVRMAQHVDHDVPLDGALAKFVRERAEASNK
jgi:hypothetical protein